MFNGERVKQLRNKIGLTQEAFGKAIGKSTQQISHLETKANNTRSDIVEQLADGLGTTTDYLLGRTDIAEIPIYKPVSEEDKGVRVPVYGKIPAGKPIEALEVDYGYVVIDKNMARGDKQFLGLKVQGDSMYPFYMDGDTVIIEINPTPNNGDDVIAFIGYDNEATLKRFHKKDADHIELEPLNKKYDSRIFGRDDVPVRILGVVREIRREV